MIRQFLAICFLSLFSFIANADDNWLIIPGLSHHVNTTTKHNPYNYGLGLEWQSSSGRDWLVGAYNNSYWKTSTFLLTELTSYHFCDTIRFRLEGGLVTGYGKAVTPMILPIWTYENKRWGIDALTIPSVAGRMGIYAIQFKVKF